LIQHCGKLIHVPCFWDAMLQLPNPLCHFVDAHTRLPGAVAGFVGAVLRKPDAGPCKRGRHHVPVRHSPC
jgi:hypothetical protein